MFRTEVVKTKNLQKHPVYKVGYPILWGIFAAYLILLLSGVEHSSESDSFIKSHFDTIRMVMMIILLLFMAVTLVSRSMLKSPARLGTLEVDTQEVRYFEHDQLIHTTLISDIQSIHLEYYSARMRNNPQGVLNYLTLKSKGTELTYEIVIGNVLEKGELGETLGEINRRIPVKVSYSVPLRKFIKDRDFNFKS